MENSLLTVTEPPVNGSACILTIRLSTRAGRANTMSVYAPTLCSTADSRDQFYGELDVAIGNIPKTEQLYIVGDFNARVGADHEAWPTCLGHHGMGKMNENGQRLLELCCHHGLSITNTFFGSKPCHKVSWRRPRAGHWHQLDPVITRRDALNNVLNTRSYHSVDCDTDHSLICASIRMQPKRFFHSKQKGHIRINISNTTYTEKNQQFIESIRTALSGIETESSEENWNTLFVTSYTTLHSQHTAKNNERILTGTLMEPVIDVKRSALINFKRDPSERNKTALRAARNKAQQTTRHCANNYWLQLCQSIQTSSDTGNIRGMYDGIKKA